MAEIETTHTLVDADDGYNFNNAAWFNTDDFVQTITGETILTGHRFTGLPAVNASDDAADPRWQPSRIHRTWALSVSALTVTASIAGSIFIIDEVNPAAFSNSRLPGLLGETIATRIATFALDAGFDGSVSADLDMAICTPIYNRTGFQGNVMFTILWVPTGAQYRVRFSDGGNPATLATASVPFDSGISGRGGSGGRSTVDQRTGQFTWEDRLIGDGFMPGVKVLPENWDAPDLPQRRRRRARPRRFGPR